MRPLLLVLLMLLLPLRAWAGDVMVLSMAHDKPAAVVSSHTGPHDTAAHDTDGHAPGAHDPGRHDGHDRHAGHGGAPAADDCPSHVACDVCNGPVLSLPVWKAEGAVARHRPAVSPPARFASLVPSRHHKPPIA